MKLSTIINVIIAFELSVAACNAAPIPPQAKAVKPQAEPLLTHSIEQLASVHHEGVNGEKTKHNNAELQTRTTRVENIFGKLIDIEGAIARAGKDYERSGGSSIYVPGSENWLAQRRLNPKENLRGYNFFSLDDQDRFKRDFNLEYLRDHPAYKAEWQRQRSRQRKNDLAKLKLLNKRRRENGLQEWSSLPKK